MGCAVHCIECTLIHAWLPVLSKGQSAAGLAKVPQFDSAISRGSGQQLTTAADITYHTLQQADWQWVWLWVWLPAYLGWKSAWDSQSEWPSPVISSSQLRGGQRDLTIS